MEIPRVAIASVSRGGKVVITSYDFFWPAADTDEVFAGLRNDMLEL